MFQKNILAMHKVFSAGPFVALVDHVREPFLLLDSGAEEQNVCSSFHTREQTSPAEMFYMSVVGAEQSHRWCLLVSRHHRAVDKAEAWAAGEETPESRDGGQEVNTRTTLSFNTGLGEEVLEEVMA
ncbi:unnamed protein product [Arctogadus glacialis]